MGYLNEFCMSLVCCCRRRTCATHAALENFLSLIFAGVLIGINIVFLRNPSRCYFTDDLCEKFSWTDTVSRSWRCFIDGSATNCEQIRLDLIKAQLAMGIVMAVLCVLYLIVYIIVLYRAKRSVRPTAAQAVMAPVSYHHQHYVTPIHPQVSVAPSAPVQIASDINSYPPIYPRLTNDRF